MRDSVKTLDKPVIVVTDMLVDFITGALACERGRNMVPSLVSLLDAARSAEIPLVFCRDAHIPDIDRELKLWGEHAMAGTPGDEIIPELKVSDKDYIITKRRYSCFFQTYLDMLLRELNCKTVILTGLQAHICVQHTAADAFQLGYDVVVATEATEAFTEQDRNAAFAYMKQMYGALLCSNEEIVAALQANNH